LTSFLPFFIPHLPASAPSNTHAHLRVAVVNFLPALLEKLNDPKEKIASPASTSIALLGKKCFEAEAGQAKDVSIKGKEKESLVGMWERQVKENALVGKGWRGKVEGMKLILGLKSELGSKMSLKPWLATLVELLEDGDSNVRETAREVSRSWAYMVG
jgi:CLIP-associating protein 1/2